jgi:hypothetical protein
MASLHGLVRGENMELGRDSDTGGQVLWGTTFSKMKKEVIMQLISPLYF